MSDWSWLPWIGGGFLALVGGLVVEQLRGERRSGDAVRVAKAEIGAIISLLQELRGSLNPEELATVGPVLTGLKTLHDRWRSSPDLSRAVGSAGQLTKLLRFESRLAQLATTVDGMRAHIQVRGKRAVHIQRTIEDIDKLTNLGEDALQVIREAEEQLPVWA